VGLEHHVCLLLAVRADESPDLHNLTIVPLLNSALDLVLVGTDVHDQYKCVGIFNLLDCALGGKRLLDDSPVVKAGQARTGAGQVLGLAGQCQRLGPVETDLR